MKRRTLLLATPMLLAQAPAVRQDDVVAPGWRRDILVRWGDRVTFDAPPFDPRTVDAEGAGAQFGWDARIAALVAPPAAADNVPRAVLAVVHPTVEPRMAFPGGVDRPEVAAMMQGASLINLERQGGRWIAVEGGFQSRRLSAQTLCRGPNGAVRGVLAPRGGSATPWGTLLLAEGDAAPWTRRLAGLDPAAYGFVVELDPLDPQGIPVKRAAPGRFAKADCAAALARDGRAAVFMAEMGEAGFLFRFLSAGPAREPDALEAGTLAVARNEGGRLGWAALAGAGDPLAEARAAGGTPFGGIASLSWDAPRGRLLIAGQEGVMEWRGDAGADAGVLALLSRLPNAACAVADARGRVLAGTDSQGRVGATAETLFLDGQPLYGAPRAAGIGGAAVLGDGTVLAIARRPGAEPGASFERPATRWPEFTPGMPPRSALVALAR